MANIQKKEHYSDEVKEYHRYVIKGVMYRVQDVCWDYNHKEEPQWFAWSLDNSYHKYATYRQCGDLIYRGISLKELWDEVQSYVGDARIPESLKQVQPFLANQT